MLIETLNENGESLKQKAWSLCHRRTEWKACDRVWTRMHIQTRLLHLVIQQRLAGTCN